MRSHCAPVCQAGSSRSGFTQGQARHEKWVVLMGAARGAGGSFLSTRCTTPGVALICYCVNMTVLMNSTPYPQGDESSAFGCENSSELAQTTEVSHHLSCAFHGQNWALFPSLSIAFLCVLGLLCPIVTFPMLYLSDWGWKCVCVCTGGEYVLLFLTVPPESHGKDREE